MTLKKEKFSYSKLNQYETCPFCYDLKYNKGIYVSEPSIAPLYGVLVHKILEIEAQEIKNGRPINYEMLKADFQNYNIPKRSKYDRDGDIFGSNLLAKKFPKDWMDFDTKSGKSYAVKAIDFLDWGIYRFPKYMEEHPELEVVGTEIGFTFEYRGYLFTGFIDRLLKERGKDRYLIFDIKTKDSPFKDKDLTTPLQFVCYARALRETYGKDIKIECYYDLPTIDLIQAAGTKGFELRGMKKIDKLLDGIEAEEFPPHSSPLCKFCSFRPHEGQPDEAQDLCPYFSLWEKDNPTYDVYFEWEGTENHEKVMQKYWERKRLEEENAGKQIDVSSFDFDF